MSLSPKQQELKDKLYALWNDWEFVQGIGPVLINDEEVQRMIDYIDSGDWASFSDLTLMALKIERNRSREEQFRQLEAIEKVLFDGTKEQMEKLPSSVSYSYNEEYRSFEVRYGRLFSKGHGAHYVPNCVRFFGDSHTFYSLDEITETLLDGTRDQIAALRGLALSYEYCPKARSATIKYGGVERRMHKIGSVPSCVKYLGNSYDFETMKSILKLD